MTYTTDKGTVTFKELEIKDGLYLLTFEKE